MPNRPTRLTEDESVLHDLLRCILIAQVVLGHLAAIALPDIPTLRMNGADNAFLIAYRLLTRFGPEAAYLFVFLSGYMVGGPLIRSFSSNTSPSFFQFTTKKLSKLAPVAFIALLLTAALDLLAINAFGKGQAYASLLPYDATATLTVVHFLGNILFIQPVAIESFGSNGPLWTLGYIAQYYLLGWVIFKLFSLDRRLGLAALLIAAGAMAYVKPEWAVLFLSWIAGSIARNITRPAFPAMCWLAAAIGLFIASNLAPPLISAAMSIATGLCFAMTFKAITLPKKMPRMRKILRRAGDGIFSLYAIHYPVCMFIFAVLYSRRTISDIEFVTFSAVSLAALIPLTLITDKASSKLSQQLS